MKSRAKSHIFHHPHTQFWIFFLLLSLLPLLHISFRQAGFSLMWSLIFIILDVTQCTLTSIAEKDEISTHCCHSQYSVHIDTYSWGLISFAAAVTKFLSSFNYFYTYNVLSHGQANDDDDDEIEWNVYLLKREMSKSRRWRKEIYDMWDKTQFTINCRCTHHACNNMDNV